MGEPHQGVRPPLGGGGDGGASDVAEDSQGYVPNETLAEMDAEVDAGRGVASRDPWTPAQREWAMGTPVPDIAARENPEWTGVDVPPPRRGGNWGSLTLRKAAEDFMDRLWAERAHLVVAFTWWWRQVCRVRRSRIMRVAGAEQFRRALHAALFRREPRRGGAAAESSAAAGAATEPAHWWATEPD